MIKYLIIGLIIYGYYKFFLAPKRIPTRRQDQIDRKDDLKDEGEYTDYEEVD